MKFTIATVASLVASTSAFTASSFAGKSLAGVPSKASETSLCMKYKVAVVGGGPAGACAAEIFAQEKGIDTVLFERKMDNAKPCGGAIPLCMIGEFDIPEDKVDRKVRYQSRRGTFFDVQDGQELYALHCIWLVVSRSNACI